VEYQQQLTPLPRGGQHLALVLKIERIKEVEHTFQTLAITRQDHMIDLNDLLKEATVIMIAREETTIRAMATGMVLEVTGMVLQVMAVLGTLIDTEVVVRTRGKMITKAMGAIILQLLLLLLTMGLLREWNKGDTG